MLWPNSKRVTMVAPFMAEQQTHAISHSVLWPNKKECFDSLPDIRAWGIVRGRLAVAGNGRFLNYLVSASFRTLISQIDKRSSFGGNTGNSKDV